MSPTATAEDLASKVESASVSPEQTAAGIRELGRQAQRLADELAMMRVLAALGITIGEFTHEVSFGFDSLDADVRTLAEFSESADGNRIGERLLAHFALLKSYVSYFEQAVQDTTRRRLVAHEVRDVVAAFETFIRPHVARHQLAFEFEPRGNALFLKPMNRAELMSVLVNLFTNSMKAIHRAKSAGRIRIAASRSGDRILLFFSDNGDGIPPENVERVFDAFFTTTLPPFGTCSDGEQLAGMGLGLKIVRDILNGVGGEIDVVEAPPEFSTCFRVSIPCASGDEVPGDAY